MIWVKASQQDVVEEIGAALGITYEDDDPLQTEEKLTKETRNAGN